MTTLVKTYPNGHSIHYTVMSVTIGDVVDAAIVATEEDGDIVISARDEPYLWAQALSLGLLPE